jgi:hypothetical protein
MEHEDDKIVSRSREVQRTVVDLFVEGWCVCHVDGLSTEMLETMAALTEAVEAAKLREIEYHNLLGYPAS